MGTTTTGTGEAGFFVLTGWTRLPLPPAAPRCGVPVKRLEELAEFVATGSETVAPKRMGGQ